MKQDCSGKPFFPEDFTVGKKVNIHGRELTITDCDQYTREFYVSAFGIIQPEAIEVPKDNFMKESTKVV